MPRPRVLHLAVSLGASAVVVAALGGYAAQAQTVTDFDVLQPTPDSNQRPPQRFGPAPPAAQAEGPARFEIPTFGNPPGSGAGSTGFDSTNSIRRKARAAARRSLGASPASLAATEVAPPRESVVAPLRLTAPVATVRPAPQLERRGAAVIAEDAAPPLSAGVVPEHRRPLPEEDPFAPLGVRAGSFLLRPAVDMSAGFDTNPTHVSGGKNSAFAIMAPELEVRSDWLRHALNADIHSSYIAYGRHFADTTTDSTGTPVSSGTPDSLDRPSLDARVDGRLDVTERSHIDGEGRLIVSTDNPGSPNIQAGLTRLPIVTTAGVTLGYTQQLNRLELSGKGSVDRSTWQESHLTDGSTSGNDDRDFNQYAGTLRGSYELTPGVKPFVEAGLDTRVHDLAVDRSGEQRDSNGIVARLGTTFEITRILTGELSGGYVTRVYKDPLLPDLNGLIFDASLIWSASALTTATLTAKSTVNETIVPGVSGTLTRDFGAEVDHAFRRWLIGSVKLGYGIDDYVGSSRHDQRHFASTLMTYKLSRTVQIKGELRHDWLKSNVDGADYTATTMTAGLRFQL